MPPGANFRFIPGCHRRDDLANVIQVMHHPGREQLLKRDLAELRVDAGELQFCRFKLPAIKSGQTVSAQFLELGEKLIEASARRFIELSQSIKRRKFAFVPPLKNDLRTRYPIRLFAVDEVPDDVECLPIPGVAFSVRPGRRKASEEGPQDCRGPLEYRDRLLKIELHGLLFFRLPFFRTLLQTLSFPERLEQLYQRAFLRVQLRCGPVYLPGTLSPELFDGNAGAVSFDHCRVYI